MISVHIKRYLNHFFSSLIVLLFSRCHAILFYSILSHPILYYSILFYLTLSHPFLFYPILLYPTVFYLSSSIPLYSIYPPLSHSILLFQILVNTTKKNVTENLTYPLLEISVGLNIFLASVNQAMDIDEAGRKNLSRIALACNMAVNALDDMSYSNNCFTVPTETGEDYRE